MTQYTNAKGKIPDLLYAELQHYFPEGGLIYITPAKSKAQYHKGQVIRMTIEGFTTKEIAIGLRISERRVNQIKKELSIWKSQCLDAAN